MFKARPCLSLLPKKTQRTKRKFLRKFLSENKILPEVKGSAFSEFLNLQDPELFRHFFKKERNQKGLILKKIKPIYSSFGAKGSDMFNQGLLKYFGSDLSQVSDLKYI